MPSIPGRAESASPVLPTTNPQAGPSQPTRTRAWSIGVNSPAAKSRNGSPQPVTAPAGARANDNTPRRSRAHTVSVSMRPTPRRTPSDTRRASVSMSPEDAAERGQRGRGSSNADQRRESIQQEMRNDTGSPVTFDLPDEHEELHDEVVGMLDVIDDHVSTVNHLQNMTNTLIFPQFPGLWSRRPEVNLQQTSSDDSLAPLTGEEQPPTASTRRRANSRPRASTVSRLFPPSATSPTSTWGKSAPTPIQETTELSPVQTLQDDIQEVEGDHELDAHVRNVLQKTSKKEKAKRIGRGVWTFVKTPMGAFTAIYGFLVAFWGAAIVLFLLGWIKTGSSNQKAVWVEISSQVENGLFTLTGVGLIPWRVRDTYRMMIISRRKRQITTRRNQQGLPPIEDPNDLPDPKEVADYTSVLNDVEAEQLRYQQEHFAKSQTWYRPHATETHRAFPISWALWNTLLMDGNSAFQCILCGCMWGLNRHQRPAWTTGCLIPLSFLCGIGAAVLIWQGSKRTKKTSKVEDKLREALGVPANTAAIPKSKNSPVVTSNDRVPTPQSPTSPTRPQGQTEMSEKATGLRRTTITFGNVKDPMSMALENGADGGRTRGATIAAPTETVREESGETQDNHGRKVLDSHNSAI